MSSTTFRVVRDDRSDVIRARERVDEQFGCEHVFREVEQPPAMKELFDERHNPVCGPRRER